MECALGDRDPVPQPDPAALPRLPLDVSFNDTR